MQLATIQGVVQHQGVGARVTFPDSDAAPDPRMSSGNLTDGLTGVRMMMLLCTTPRLYYSHYKCSQCHYSTGSQTPWDSRWVGFVPGKDAVVVVELPADVQWPLRSLAVSCLATPPLHFTDGDRTKAVARNITTWWGWGEGGEYRE